MNETDMNPSPGWQGRLPEAPQQLHAIANDIQERHAMSANILRLLAEDIDRARAELDCRGAAIERVQKLCERADRIVSGSQRAASIRTSDIRRALDEETT